MNQDFALGDLVWAKLKGFSYWPARIHMPPPDSKTSLLKKQQCYVFFFGTREFSWIPLKNITPHTDARVASARQKKMTQSLKAAVDEIEAAAGAQASDVEEEQLKSNVTKEKKSESSAATKATNENVKSAAMTSSPAKTKMLSQATPGSKKSGRAKKAKRPVPYPSVRMTASPSKPNEYQDLYENLTNSIGTSSTRVAVIKPFDDRAASTSQAAGATITKRDYFPLPPPIPLELKTLSEAFASKEITPTTKTIGWLGLGTMGQRIVKNLLLTSHKVVIWNRTTAKCKPFEEIGAVIADTPADVVLNADIIFSCVSDSDAVKQLMFENFGILKGLDKSRGQELDKTRGQELDKGKGQELDKSRKQEMAKVYVEMSVVDPDTSIKMADAVVQRGGLYLEAPLNGSAKLAEDGQLLIIASGNEEVYRECESCFYTMSKDSVFMGTEYGLASKVNLIVNSMLGDTYATVAQVMALAENVGLTQLEVKKCLEMHPLGVSSVMDMVHAVGEKDFLPNISLKYLQQNIFMTMRMAARCKQPMPVTGAANNLFKHAKLLRYSEHDASAVYFGAKY